MVNHWPNNLREMIENNNIVNNKVIHKKLTIKSTKFYQLCFIKNKIFCKHLKSTNSFTCFTTIFFKFTTNQIAEAKIYLLECTHFQKQYIRNSECLFHFNLNNSRNRIKSLDYNKLILLEQHFLSNSVKLHRCKVCHPRKNI